MSFDKKKEIRNSYKNSKTDMGIYSIVENDSNKMWIGIAKDLKGIINSIQFQLDLGSHPNKELQEQWKKFGKTAFKIDVLDKLDYDKENPDRDYSYDLKTLLDMWKEKLSCNTVY
jgi:hypothetical protein